VHGRLESPPYSTLASTLAGENDARKDKATRQTVKEQKRRAMRLNLRKRLINPKGTINQ
jgi:hypothetical protein